MDEIKYMEPLVSVVIPYYSGIQWLEEAIDSVFLQTYKNIEVILVDDGSCDNVIELTYKYQTNKLIYIKQENSGPAKARNTGIINAKGKYIAFLDSDDYWDDNKLEVQVLKMEETNSVWSQHSYEKFNDSGSLGIVDTAKYKGDVSKDLYISFKVQTSCFMVNRNYIIDNGCFFNEEKRYGEDCDFYEEIALKNNKLLYVDHVKSHFRIRENNAGFMSSIQIVARARLYNDHKENLFFIETVGVLGLFAYKYCDLLSKLYFSKHKNKLSKSVSNLLYVMPWTVFKYKASRLHNKR